MFCRQIWILEENLRGGSCVYSIIFRSHIMDQSWSLFRETRVALVNKGLKLKTERKKQYKCMCIMPINIYNTWISLFSWNHVNAQKGSLLLTEVLTYMHDHISIVFFVFLTIWQSHSRGFEFSSFLTNCIHKWSNMSADFEKQNKKTFLTFFAFL